jgi:nucleotide-binding universal stress UspA family protein
MPRGEQITQRCRACNKVKPVEAFGWVARKARPTRTCRACWKDPASARRMAGLESTEELLLYYPHVRSLVEDLNRHLAESLAEGKPVERKMPQLGEIFFSEVTEEAYRTIVRALIAKAEQGDVRATELLLEERQRRLGEPTPESVQETFEELFKLDPLAANRDTK